MKNEAKKYLKDKLIEFQLKNAELKHTLNKQKDEFQSREKELRMELFEVLDAFDNLFKNIKEKETTFDKSKRMLLKNVRAVYNKLTTILKSRDIVKIEFPENKARRGYCKIAATRKVPGIENEIILSVLKSGYIDKKEDVVIRPAEVITVNNSE